MTSSTLGPDADGHPSPAPLPPPPDAPPATPELSPAAVVKPKVRTEPPPNLDLQATGATDHPDNHDMAIDPATVAIAAAAAGASEPPQTPENPSTKPPPEHLQPDDFPFAEHPIETHVLMLALASLQQQGASLARPNGHSRFNPPPTVAPADMTLPTPKAENRDPMNMAAANTHGPLQTHALQGLESFARIEFADSVFQMTTYGVIIGRDQRAMEQARRDKRRDDEYYKRLNAAALLGLPPPERPTYVPRFSRSYVSEEGGMLGPAADGGDDCDRPAKRRKTVNSGEIDGSPPRDLANEPSPQPNQESGMIKERQYIEHTPGAAAVDLNLLKPSPHHVPFIGIHSPGPDIATKTKAISREHLKIQFNQDKGVFEAIPLHTNGFFHEDNHYKDESVVLRSGDRLQIKDVNFVFIINGVPYGHTGAEDDIDEAEISRRRAEGGKEMSFDFESVHEHGKVIQETSEEEEDEEDQAEVASPAKLNSDDEPLSELDEDEYELIAQEEEQAVDEDEVMESVEPEETEETPAPVLPDPPKKRGPGRPPKNGIRSKREERLLRKQALEEAKKNAPPPVPGDPPVKRKVGRPRKHPLPEGAEDKPEKRKYKPRKPKNEEGGEEDGEKTVKEKRREKPKTPPLELKKEDFTEEQLQKPNKNYGVLIDEVLTEAPQDGLTLKQIYKRIQKKYPYYFFVVDTKGWESSVRHNLIGNDAFKKNEETHLWCRVPGIELDAGKKRKAVSPDRTVAAMHNMNATQWTQQAQHPQYQVPQGYQMAPAQTNNYTIPPGMPQQAVPMQGQPKPAVPPQQLQQPVQTAGVVAPGLAPNQQPQPRPNFQPPPAQAIASTTQIPGYMQGNNAPRPAAGPANAYSSPYVNKPPPAITPATHPGQHPAAGQHQPVQYPAPAQRPQVMHQQAHPHAARPGVAMPQAHGAHPGAVNGSAVAPAPVMPQLKPAIDPDVANFLKNFRVQVISQLERRLPKTAELVAMSVVNRGLGLSTTSIVGTELAGFERIIQGVFDTARQKFARLAHPKLVEVLTSFKHHWVEAIKAKVGEAKAEALLLSSIDRVLGLCDSSILQPTNETERKEFEDAENLFMPLIRQKVTEFQTSVAMASVNGGAAAR